MIRVFLSSSSEQLSVAKALEANLADEGVEPTLWSREAHGASQYNLESLLIESKSSDFAVFIFSPDDKVEIRGEQFAVVRDNVLFELGLFIGTLGRERCYIARSETAEMRMPSDLDGVSVMEYPPERSDGNLRRSLGPIATRIGELARSKVVSLASELTPNDLELLRACRDSSMPSSQAYKAFGTPSEEWVDKLCIRFLKLFERGLVERTWDTEVTATRRGLLLADAKRKPS